ncbi:MAG: D-alanyl-D-alanine carboxypeptidase/D-alanyl-D-alanine-endopeptidase [Cytophagales bacterium]|nr:D-alanyl-D-alanine carboxypeptidase/D-alanyl-D-alanine-endopeptidase [Armatimonadota bacterium]
MNPHVLLSIGLTALSLAAPAGAAFAQNAVIPPPAVAFRRATGTEVGARIDRALAVPALKNAVVGILVRSLIDGRTLYERNPDLALVPASNMKLLTATAALVKLGTDFRYKTTLLHTGSIDRNGTLNGDLYLRGSGDPSLDSKRLLEMAQKLRAAGVQKINGRILADATAFDDQRIGDGWQWDDEAYYYSAQVAGLNCDENVIALEVRPADRIGAPAQVVVGGADSRLLAFEQTRYVQVTNRAVTTPGATTGAAGLSTGIKPEAKLRFSRARATNELIVGGVIPLGSAPVSEALTIEDPALFTATRFGELCPVGGVNLPSVKDRRIEKGKTPPTATLLVETESTPLGDLVKQFLKRSDNLFGEALLKTVGGGTTGAGVQAVVDVLKDGGVDSSGLTMADGSGLSRTDTVTPRLLTSLLIFADRKLDTDRRGALINGLPEAGIDGTLRNRMKGTAAEAHVRAKTGSLSNVSSLSGYLQTKRGERLVFSILMNNFALGNARAARAAQDAIAVALTDAPQDMGRGKTARPRGAKE